MTARVLPILDDKSKVKNNFIIFLIFKYLVLVGDGKRKIESGNSSLSSPKPVASF